MRHHENRSKIIPHSLQPLNTLVFSSRPRSICRGFTFIELLVVVTVIGILASMLLPAMVQVRSGASTTWCLNNLARLTLAWHTYATDNSDALPSNRWRAVTWEDDCPDGYQTGADCWVLGDAKTDRDTWGIQNGSLFNYVKAVDCYHCPADTSTVDGQPKLLRKRSYSMSYYMNGIEHKPERKTKYSLVTNPSRVFVFLDEHENWIDDGVFYVHVPGDAGEHAAGPHWMDIPTNRHGGGCDLSFADGHTAHWKWRWPFRSENDNSVTNSLDLQDLRRLQEGIPAR